LLDSLPEESPKYVVDGKFKDTPSPGMLSDETLRERVRQYPNVTLIDAPNLMEHETRNMYLTHMKDHKYGFLIDSDEYLESPDWDSVLEILKPLDTGFMHVVLEGELHDNTYRTYPRIFINPKKWEYYKAHFIMRNRETGEIADNIHAKGEFIDHGILLIRHDKSLRSEEFAKMEDEYKRILIEYEAPIRKAYKEGDKSLFSSL